MVKLRLVKAEEWANWLGWAYQSVFGELESKPHTIDCLYIAFVNGKPAAWGSYERRERDAAAYLNSCGVLEGFRGLRLQNALIKKRLSHAYNSGLTVAYTYTHAGNVQSNNNLIRTGFLLWQPAHWGGESWPRSGEPWLYWYRYLRGRGRGNGKQ